jgi:predicted nucleotidyltransferase
MKTALETANEMERLGIIGRYAIAGSVAIIYYAAPVDTDDLDIFFLHGLKSTEVFSMASIYKHLLTKGFVPERFTVIIDGVKVQFVPSTGPLSDEALEAAEEVTVFGVKTRVIVPEYLIALKLQAGRPKDFLHVIHLLDTSRRTIDLRRLEEIVAKHGMSDKWTQFQEKTSWKRP